MKKIEDYNIGKLKHEVVQNSEGGYVFDETDPIKAFLECIAKGMPVRSACKYAMLDFKTIKNWLEIGAKDFENDVDSPYRNLFTREQRAEAVFEGRMLETVTNAAKNGAWNPAMELLKRRMPTDYGDKQEIKLDDDGVIINMDVGGATTIKSKPALENVKVSDDV